MENEFHKVQKILIDEDVPEFISLIPNEAIPVSVKSNLKQLSKINLAEISKDNNLLEFITDFNQPIEADLNLIEKLLSKYPAVTGDFFKEEKVKEKNNTSEFQTASKTNVIDSKKEILDSKKECNVDEYILERISKEILETTINITWDDIVGLENVKKAINEIVLWPMMRPDLFTGLRGPPKGLLLFGPPGTGKTMIGKCIASQCKATFFSISASSLTSKWVGEGEKMVRALFYLARKMSPSVIFIDEIDSLLSQRTDNENEGSRRIKTEFLVQFDGAAVDDKERILIVGATNRPHEIDDAARRRLVKRIYVPLPEFEARKKMITQLVSCYSNKLNDDNISEIANLVDGYSGSDIFNLCREASLEPLREIEDINNFKTEDTRPININDFVKATKQIRKSVSQSDLTAYHEWNELFGSVQGII